MIPIICHVIYFLMQLLLEGHRVTNFVDGSNSCHTQYLVTGSGNSRVNSSSSSSSTRIELDAYKIWKMHDRALMQLITTTLSSIALYCAIGSTRSQDLWTCLKEQFSTVTRTSIFQMKFELQIIKKSNDSITV